MHHIKKQNKRTPKGHATILFNENQYWIKRESLQQKSCTLKFDKKNIAPLIRNVFVLGLDSTFKKGFFFPAYQILPHSCLAFAWEAGAQLYDLLLGRCIPQNFQNLTSLLLITKKTEIMIMQNTKQYWIKRCSTKNFCTPNFV